MYVLWCHDEVLNALPLHTRALRLAAVRMPVLGPDPAEAHFPYRQPASRSVRLTKSRNKDERHGSSFFECAWHALPVAVALVLASKLIAESSTACDGRSII